MISCFEFTADNYSTKTSFVYKLVMFMLDKMDGKVNKIVFVGTYVHLLTSVELTYELLLLRQIIVRNFTIIHSD